nr:PREDICTED: uncharacterized protein LOC102692793 isoform X1 [Lepisosteus oculatus]
MTQDDAGYRGSEASGLPDAGERAHLEQQHSEEEEWGSSLMQETEITAAEGKETLSEQHTESRQSVGDLETVPMMKTESESETPGPLVAEGFTEKFNNLDSNLFKNSCNELDNFNPTEHDMEPQLIDPAELQTDIPGEENSTEIQHTEESQYRQEQQRQVQGLIITRPCSVKVERLSLQRSFKQS